MDTKYFKEKLESEKKILEQSLSELAHQDPTNPDDWKTNPEDLNIEVADKNELADIFEESANKEAIEIELENQLNQIKTALKKIEKGTYGICEKCNGPIEEQRLKANSSATTCIKHAGSV